MLLETMVNPSWLQVLWLILVAVLWVGYFFLEGFDYGVAMLLPFVGKNDLERRVMVNTIGPVWDGNEVWLLTAGGAMFAAFPGWYATAFSGLYLPLFLVLMGLILRGVAFEYRGKRPEWEWRNRWDWAAAVGSFIPSLVFGVGFANFLLGLPVKNLETIGGQVPLFGGTFLGLFSPFALLGGLMFVALFILHGATFAALKTAGEIHDRLKGIAVKAGLGAGALLLIFIVWGNLLPTLPGQLGGLRTLAWIAGVGAVALVGAAVLMTQRGRDGWAFIASGLGVVLMVVMIFSHLYPGLGFDNTAVITAGGVPLDVTTASSSPLTLTIMSIAAACLVPVVLVYQAWSYKVFRRRISVDILPDDTKALPVGG